MRFTKPLPVRLASHGAIVTRPRLALLEKGIGAAICVSHKGGLATPHMRDQTVQVEVPAGMLEVIVTGEALVVGS